MEEEAKIVLAIVGWRGMTSDKHGTLFADAMTSFVLRHGVPHEVVSGGAKGADTLGEAWARKRGIRLVILKPDWKRGGRRAGLARNTDIVAACTHMIAFPHDSGTGTQDSIKKALLLNKLDTVVKL